jgi:uncharacterized protein (DUF1800 family)
MRRWPVDSTAGGTPSISEGRTEEIFADRFEDTSGDAEGFARQALERLTYGARPEDLNHFLALGSSSETRLAAWVDEQLDPQSLDESDLHHRLAAIPFETLDKTIVELWADHVTGSMASWPERYLPVSETEAARLIRAVYAQRQLNEMVVEFWHDHFNVAGWEFSIAPVFVQHDRDVVRAHSLGNFRQLLGAVARSTAMLYYLDNRENRAGGYNENWVREMLELHTLGVDAYYPGATHGHVPPGDDGLAAGYSDADVYDAARCFTGWTVRNGHWQFPPGPEFNTGEFFYYSDWHEGGSKYVLGQWIAHTGQSEAELVMDLACQHSQTAHHLAHKLCRRFVSDEPPASLVESAAVVWQEHWQADDQIARVLRHILNSEEFRSGSGEKLRRPFEMVAAALRKTGAEIAPKDRFSGWQPWDEFFTRLQQTGHGSFRWPAPDGFPDTADLWSSVSVMGQVWRLLSRLPELRESEGDPLMRIHELTVSHLSPQQRSARGLVDFWIQRLVGRPLAGQRRGELIDFLRQNADADTPLDIESNLPDGHWSASNLSAHYTPARLRAAVALICTCPEFHRR